MGIVGIFALPVLAQTSSSSVFENAYNALYGTFRRARAVVYIMGGFGLAGVATATIFGKLNVRWLAMIAVALGVLGLTEKIVVWSVQAGRGVAPVSTFTITGTTVTVAGGADAIPGATYDTIYQPEDSDFRRHVIERLNNDPAATLSDAVLSDVNNGTTNSDTIARQNVLTSPVDGAMARDILRIIGEKEFEDYLDYKTGGKADKTDKEVEEQRKRVAEYEARIRGNQETESGKKDQEWITEINNALTK